MSLPDLPLTVFTHLGAIPVVREPILEEEKRRGDCVLAQRRIRIVPEIAPEVAWQTLGHELTHAILWDGAVEHTLTERQHEIVCDIIGTWLAAAVASGSVSFRHTVAE